MGHLQMQLRRPEQWCYWIESRSADSVMVSLHTFRVLARSDIVKGTVLQVF
jgi:hypothetical protein